MTRRQLNPRPERIWQWCEPCQTHIDARLAHDPHSPDHEHYRGDPTTMATATASTPPAPPLTAHAKLQDTDIDGDIVRRGIKRTLPCDLTEAEFLRIARQRVDKEALLDQVVEDFDKIKAKHKSAVDELQGEIDKARQELHTGQQDRTVLCVEVFRRDDGGSGWVDTLRMDVLTAAYGAAIALAATPDEARRGAAEQARVEFRPATPTEAQRYLPGVEGYAVDAAASKGPLLDQAAAAQGRARAVGGDEDSEDDGVPDGADSEDEDDGLSDAPADETPAQRSARESEEGRAARRAAGKGGKRRGGKGGGKGGAK